jgi:hypothetical protein
MHRADSLTGFGNRPDFTPSNQLVFPSGITLSTCGKRKNPVSGISCTSHSLPFHSHSTTGTWQMSRRIALAASLIAMLRCTSHLRDRLAPAPQVGGQIIRLTFLEKARSTMLARLLCNHAFCTFAALEKPGAKGSSCPSQIRAPDNLDLSQPSLAARRFPIASPYPVRRSACFSFSRTPISPSGDLFLSLCTEAGARRNETNGFHKAGFPKV